MLSKLLWALAVLSVTLTAQDKVAALGARLAEDVVRDSETIDDTFLNAFITAIGNKVAKQMPDTGFPWKFTVIRHSQCGQVCPPLSLPGGYIFVSLDLIASTQSEAELTGLLAHAMAHLVVPSVQSSSAATIPITYIGDDCNSNLLPTAFRDAHRLRELEADQAGVQAMAAAGYDPAALTGYLVRTQDAERITRLNALIASLPMRTYQTSGEFDLVHEAVGKLAPPIFSSKHSPPSLRSPNRP